MKHIEKPLWNRITRKQQSNILKHIKYLISGNLGAEFNMKDFDDFRCYGFTETHTCGTSGCSLGHASISIEKKSYNESWTEFGTRIFGINDVTMAYSWEWCFGEFWENDPISAAKRLFYLCLFGVPKRYKEMINDNSKYPKIFENDIKIFENDTKIYDVYMVKTKIQINA